MLGYFLLKYYFNFDIYICLPNNYYIFWNGFSNIYKITGALPDNDDTDALFVNVDIDWLFYKEDTCWIFDNEENLIYFLYIFAIAF